MDTTTNARKTTQGIILPETFPTANQREALRSLLVMNRDDATLELCFTMDSIMKASYKGEGSNAEIMDAWSRAEHDFAEATGMSWENAIEGIEIEEPKEPKEPKAQKQEQKAQKQEQKAPTIQGLDKETEEDLAALVKAHPFRMIQGNSYANAFKGACSSRRAGLAWHVWADRMANVGLNRSLIAYVVLRVYKMDRRELLGIKR